MSEPFDLDPRDASSVLRWEKKKFWKGWRKIEDEKMRVKRAEEMTDLFEGDDIFDEEDLVVDWDPDAGVMDVMV